MMMCEPCRGHLLEIAWVSCSHGRLPPLERPACGPLCRIVRRVPSVAVCQGNPVLHIEQGHSPEQEEAAVIQLTPCVPARGVL